MGKNEVKPDDSIELNSSQTSLASRTNYSNFSASSSYIKPILPKPLSVNDEESPKPGENKDKPKKIKKERKPHSKFKKGLAFFIINFGMTGMVLVYAVVGAFLFKTIEQAAATEDCQTRQGNSLNILNEYRVKIFNYLSYNVTFNPVISSSFYGNETIMKDGPEMYNPVIHNWLKDMRTLIMEKPFNGEYKDDYCQSVDHWEFLNSLLFTLTILTSIGYGHITLKSWEGQMVLMCYALLGLPMFLLMVVKISNLLADLFIFFYKYILCCPCLFYKGIREMSDEDGQEENEDDIENDINNTDGPFDESGFIKEGRTESGAKSVGSMRTSSGRLIIGSVTKEVTIPKIELSTHKKFDESKVEVYDDNESIEYDDDDESIRIPITITLSILLGYITFGAFMFKSLEDHDGSHKWSIVGSAYFSFISMSTIGFGDYAPGVAYIDEQEHGKATRNLLIASIYLIIGICVLGMSISLMQEGLMDNIKNIMVRLKIIEPKTDDEDESGEIAVIDTEKDEKTFQ